jgi:hypothetical protein
MILYLPEIIVETTTALQCQLHSLCGQQRRLSHQDAPNMSFENIVSIMKTYKPVVKLNGHGEAPAHKRFFDMSQVPVRAGCKVAFQTNATLLVPEISRRLLSYHGPDKLMSISIAIDGVGDVSNKVRRKADLGWYVNNIKTFWDLGAESKSHTLISTLNSRRCF